MAIQIVPRTDLTPLNGDVVAPEQGFRPPVAYEGNRTHDAIVIEAQQNGVLQHGIHWQQTLGNRLIGDLIVNGGAEMIRTSLSLQQMLPLTERLDPGMQQALQGALSALYQQGMAVIQQSSVISQQNIGEVASRPPTGEAVLTQWKKEEKEECQREERQRERELEEERWRYQERNRPPTLLELIFGRK